MYIAESNDVPCKAWPAKWEPQAKNANPDAKRLCFSCPEVQACRDATLEWEAEHNQIEIGVRGALTELERKNILRRRNRRRKAA